MMAHTLKDSEDVIPGQVDSACDQCQGAPLSEQGVLVSSLLLRDPFTYTC